MGIREHSTKPNRLFAKLIMKRNANPNLTYVLLEGSTDEAVWTTYKADKCELLPASGKDNAFATLQLVNEKQPDWKNVAAILDPDYWLIEQSNELNTANLLYDDSPDLEIMLTTSPALEKVVLNTIKVDDPDAYAQQLRQKSLRLAMEYGYFRLVDYRHRQYNLGLSGVSFEAVIERDTLQLDTELIANTLVDSSSISASELLEQVETLRREFPANVKLCRGRDVLSIMACLIDFDQDVSGKAKIQTRQNELSRVLRMAYEFVYFVATKLYKRIREWESRNTPFRIISTTFGKDTSL